MAPFAITAYTVHRARGVSEANRAALWFSCARFLRWLTVGTLLAWWVATDLVHWKEKYDVFLESRGFLGLPGAAIISPIVFWLPPICVLLLCQVFLKPVYAGVRRIEWSRAELVRQMAYGLGAGFLPLLLVISGISRMNEDGDLRSFLVAFAIAVVSIFFFGRRLRKLMQLSPFALTNGELRDRAFFLAAQLHVKLKQIYLLPPSKSRMANAFARSGHSILLTHFLISHLTRREVDAVIAHELAHLKHDHPRFLGFAMMGGFAAVAVPYFFYPWQRDWKPVFDVLFILVPLLSFYFVARRFEFTADATSVRTTGDPEALITCLVKLHRLNLMPLQWGKWNERLMTHPSTVRRAESIARLSGLSKERLAELLDECTQAQSRQPQDDEAANSSQRYPLPSPESIRQKVFSTEYKQSLSSRNYLLQIAIMAMLPSFLLLGLNALGIFTSGFQIFLLALSLAVAIFLAFLNFAPFLSLRGLQRKMLVLAEAQGAVPSDALHGGDATLVGLSPGPAPRIFEGNYSWDVGHFYFAGDRLFYCGEETRFSLRRDQVVAVQPGPGFPGWFRAKSLYIVWRDTETGSSAIFNVRPLAVRSVLAMNRGVQQLAERIGAWRLSGSPDLKNTDQGQALPPPDVRAVTSTSITDSSKPQQLFSIFIVVGFFSILLAGFLQMPFEGIFLIYSNDIDSTVSSSDISGWYAILCSLALYLLFIVPLLSARSASVSLSADASLNPSPPPRSTPLT